MSKLLVRPKIYPKECIVSYLVRVSETNDFKHIGHLLQHAGLPWKNLRAPTYQMLTGEYDIEPYFSALGLEYIKPRTAEIYDSTRSPSFTTKIFVKHPKICPQCLAEEGYCQDIWSYIPYTSCHKHKLMLVDTDPQSHARLSWYRGSQNKFSIGDIETIAAQKSASADNLAMSKTIAYLIVRQELPKSTPPILKGLTFSEALSVIHFIAHYQYRLFHNELFAPTSMDNLTVSHHYTEAWKTLKKWPKAFYLLLSQYIDSPMSERGQSGINKHFRDIHEKLHRQRTNKGISRLRFAFDQYIDLKWPSAIQVNRLSRISLSSNERPLINLKEARRILQCRPERIRKLIQQDQLQVHHFKDKAHFMREEVQSIANRYQSNWTMEQACSEIELSRYHLKQLLDANLINALQRADNQNRDWLICKKGWLKQVNTLEKLATKSCALNGISLCGLQKNGFSITEVFQLIQNKRVQFQFTRNGAKPYSFKQVSNFHLNNRP